MKTLRILCAAVYYDDGKKHEHQPTNIYNGFVICGHRHHNCLLLLFELVKDTNKEKIIQGFLTSNNTFVDRQEAFAIALEANQIINSYAKCPALVSEDLY